MWCSDTRKRLLPARRKPLLLCTNRPGKYFPVSPGPDHVARTHEDRVDRRIRGNIASSGPNASARAKRAGLGTRGDSSERTGGWVAQFSRAKAQIASFSSWTDVPRSTFVAPRRWARKYVRLTTSSATHTHCEPNVGTGNSSQ